ncbi:ribosomal protein S10 domain-containing protein, partial [Kockovaella imperatae]
PKPIPKTHGILVATLEMHANFVENLEFYSQWCYLSARSFGMPACRPDRLPRTKELITVPKSPFVHKKFQENFQKLTFKRMIRVYDTSPQTLDLWLRYIARNSLGGITMK